MNPVNIALALVWKGPLLLIARRRKDAHLGDFWEFPGGRIDVTENAAQAAMREALEETGIVCSPTKNRANFEFEYPDRKLVFHPVDCVWVSGEPQALGCVEPRWVSREAILQYPFPPANAQLLRDLTRCWPPK